MTFSCAIVIIRFKPPMRRETDLHESSAGPVSYEPVEMIAGARDCGVLFLCDHASSAMPAEYGNLGLTTEEFERHIAYDIGAAPLTRALAHHFGAPALLANFSRLLVDPNRGADDPTLVMRLSDRTIVPGNARIDATEIERRRQRFWQPYRDGTARMIEAMLASGVVPAIVSIHSFTPVWKGVARPWQVSVLWDSDPRMAVSFIAALRAEGLVVGDNEPYDGALEGDTLYQHATQRGLAHMLIEMRQDLVAGADEVAHWAERLARHLRPVLAEPATHIIRHHASRAAPRRRHVEGAQR
jgi:predicted N-formylglutamate amidohydrolase